MGKIYIKGNGFNPPRAETFFFEFLPDFSVYCSTRGVITGSMFKKTFLLLVGFLDGDVKDPLAPIQGGGSQILLLVGISACFLHIVDI